MGLELAGRGAEGRGGGGDGGGAYNTRRRGDGATLIRCATIGLL